MSQIVNKFLKQMPAHTIKGNNTASTANPLDLTTAQVTAELNQFTTSLQGVVPGSGGGTTNFLRADGTWSPPPSSGSPQIAIFSEQYSSGTQGSTYNSGAWNIRQLNTTDTSQSWASLSSAQITLDAGTYELYAYGINFYVNASKAKWYNVTDSTDVLIGSSEYSGAGMATTTTTRSTIIGVFTIASTKTFELQQQVQTTQPSNGGGIASSFGVNELYCLVKLTKL